MPSFKTSMEVAGSLRTVPVQLTDGATIATDAALGNTFRVTLTADRILGAPTRPTDGQRAIWEISVGATACALTLNTGTGGFAFGAGITTITPVAANTTDFIGAIYRSSVNKWRVIAYAKGY